jgi:hypothetical protein
MKRELRFDPELPSELQRILASTDDSGEHRFLPGWTVARCEFAVDQPHRQAIIIELRRDSGPPMDLEILASDFGGDFADPDDALPDVPYSVMAMNLSDLVQETVFRLVGSERRSLRLTR